MTKRFNVKTTDGGRHGIDADNEAQARAKVAEKTQAPISKMREIEPGTPVGRDRQV